MSERLMIILLAVAYVWLSWTAEVHGEQAFLPVVMQPTPAPAPTPTLMLSSTAWVSPVRTPVASR